MAARLDAVAVGPAAVPQSKVAVAEPQGAAVGVAEYRAGPQAAVAVAEPRAAQEA